MQSTSRAAGRRAPLILAVFALALAAAAPASAAPSGWKAVGTAEFTAFNQRATFSAHSEPGGADPRGYVTFHDLTTGFQANGHVTCLMLHSPQEATIGYVVENGDQVGRVEYLFLRDDRPADKRQPRDGANRGGGFGLDPTACPPFAPLVPIKGNVLIAGS